MLEIVSKYTTTMNIFHFRFTSFTHYEMFNSTSTAIYQKPKKRKYEMNRTCDNTFKPWDTRRLAVTEPIPELAPVTSAIFPR